MTEQRLTRAFHSYFYQDITQDGGKPQRTQSSIVRTNCMDS